MVNNHNNVPIYDLSLIQALVGQDEFVLANKRAVRNTQSLGWENAMIKDFIAALRAEHFRKRFLQMSAFDGRKTFDADGYKMCFDEDSRCQGNERHHSTFWIKLAIETTNDGDSVAIISIHLDGQP